MIKLSPQQEKFAQEIVKGKSQAEAYRIAYPKSKNWKEKTLYNRASELMSNRDVSGRVEELRTPVIEKVQVTAEYVLGTIMRVIEVSGQTRQTPDGQDILVDAGAVLKGTELLGKHLKLFTDKQETLLAGGIKVNVVSGVPDTDE